MGIIHSSLLIVFEASLTYAIFCLCNSPILPKLLSDDSIIYSAQPSTRSSIEDYAFTTTHSALRFDTQALILPVASLSFLRFVVGFYSFGIYVTHINRETSLKKNKEHKKKASAEGVECTTNSTNIDALLWFMLLQGNEIYIYMQTFTAGILESFNVRQS